ncbi:MAG: YkvA family protein [Hyphomicrobiales bacterium]
MMASGDEALVRERFWPKLAKVAARLPFAEDAVASYYCAFDRQTPVQAKGMLIAALAYFILPVDAIPDFLLGLGFTDDLAVIATAISMIRRHMKPEHRERARAALEKLA